MYHFNIDRRGVMDWNPLYHAAVGPEFESWFGHGYFVRFISMWNSIPVQVSQLLGKYLFLFFRVIFFNKKNSYWLEHNKNQRQGKLEN